ncbi:MAG: hypothetical protein C0436_04985 [Alphaproteobacteria bacterium]|nr:hypothetical protein [Alphaproteobacteria bacterium]
MADPTPSGYMRLNDRNRDGRIDANEFQASRDPRSGAMTPLSPHFSEQGLSVVCADPALKQALDGIERERFGFMQEGRTVTTQDVQRNFERTAQFYGDVARRLDSGDMVSASRLSSEERSRLSQEFRDLARDAVNSPRETASMTQMFNGTFRDELRQFPGGVTYAPAQDCVVGELPTQRNAAAPSDPSRGRG